MRLLRLLGVFIAALQLATGAAASDSCRAILDAAAHTNGAERVRMRQVLVLGDGTEVRREWRVIDNRRYTKGGEDGWIENQRPDDWMRAFDGHISNCKRAGQDVVDGVAATVWTYSRDLDGARRMVKMWMEEEPLRVIRTEIDFESGKSRYRRSISQFDYAEDIERPEGARRK